MTMSRWLTVCLVLSLACGGRRQEGGADTTMVFTNAAPCPVRVAPSRDSVVAALGAYHAKKITADSAASIMLAYLDTGKELNVTVDDELQAAITRAMGKCTPRH